MSNPMGIPYAPDSIEGLLIQIQRRLNEVENRERGTGRRGWKEATVLQPGATALDNGFPSWRMLNDGRIELRGRLNLNGGTVANGTRVLRLPGRCAPPGDGASRRAWSSVVGPCSTLGINPGMYRLDIERSIIIDPISREELIYADIIAMPSQSQPLTDWIGFDHVIFDPNIYVDAVAPVPAADHTRTFGRGYPRASDGAHVVTHIPGEFGIAILGYTGGGKVTIIPGVDAPPAPPPIGP